MKKIIIEIGGQSTLNLLSKTSDGFMEVSINDNGEVKDYGYLIESDAIQIINHLKKEFEI